MHSESKPYTAARLIIVLILINLIFSASQLFAGELDKQRIWAGLDLFPTMLAADTNIQEKKTDNNRLLILLIYRDRKTDAEDMAGYLKKIGSIRKIPLSIDVVAYEKLTNYPVKSISGVFLTQKAPEYQKTVITFGEIHHILIFSPFAGDVEQGIQGGILISDIVKPYVNTGALSRAHITLKLFFMNAAERYEP